MKKTLRAIIAALLAAVMAMGCTSAFAAEENAQLTWQYYNWEYCYDYAGELNIGENTVTTPEDSYYCYFVFNAEESGFYTIGFTDYAYDGWIGVPETVEDGIAYNEADRLFHRAENNFIRLTLKLSEGENIIGFDLNNRLSNKTLEIVYEGSEIDSVNIDRSLLLGRDVYSNGELCEIYAETVISFSSGTEITLNYIEGLIAKDIEKGSNTVTFSFADETVDLTVDVYLINDVIKDVEISNIEDYLNTKVYYDYYESYPPIDETFTFTFSDGSTQSVIYSSEYDNWITLPDGTEAYFYVSTDKTDGKYILNVMVADYTVKSYECSEVKASTDENLVNLAFNGRYYLSRASRHFRYAFIAALECDNIGEFIEYGAAESADYFKSSATAFLSIFKEIFAFISFLI